MKNRKRSVTSTILIILLAVCTPETRSEQKKADISFIIGTVSVKRRGKIIQPRQGDPVFNGDIFRLLKQSIVEFSFPGEKRKLRITGPKIFMFKFDLLNKRIRRGDAATGFTKLLAKNSPPYLPRTIVSAVRGKEGQGKKQELNRTGKEKLKKAIALMGLGEYTEAGDLFNEIEKISGLNRHVKALVNFYRGEIRFHEMDYEKALAYYMAAAKYRRRRFRHREESYVRAVICADLTGKTEVLADLLGKYEKEYGERGKYGEMLEVYR